MFGSSILDVAIGLSFIYLLLALICAHVNEVIASYYNRRGEFLEKGILRLTGGDAALAKRVLGHPLIASLGGGGAKPSYIPASKFALALMDIVTGDKNTADPAALQEGLKTTGNDAFKKAVGTVLADTNESLISDQHKIEAWFDACMDRISGDYKRTTHLWIWGLALAVTMVFNANSLRMFHTLWTSQTVRAAVVEAAKGRAQMERPEEILPLVEYKDPDKPNEGTPVQVQKDAVTPQEMQLLEQLTGWSGEVGAWQKQLQNPFSQGFLLWLLSHLVGWLITTAAVSLGAPFWFDTLNRFISLRKSGGVPAPSAP